MFRLTILMHLVLNTVLLSQDIDTFISKFQNTDALEHAPWGLYAKYVKTDETIFDHNGHLSLTPASGLKLLTTAAALDILGSNFQFTTQLYIDGIIKNNTLDGNLIIIGGGDPTLGTANEYGTLPLDSLMQEWAYAVMQKGIQKITGDIICFTGLLEEQSISDYWFWSDIGNYYGAGSFSLNINDNLYYLFFKPGGRVGSPAKVIRTEPAMEGLEFVNYMKTGPSGSGDNGYIYCAPRTFKATLRGTIPKRRREFSIKGSIPDPPLFAARYFRSTLNKNNIEIMGTARTSFEQFTLKKENLFHETKSPLLKDIVKIINHKSHNLYTEVVGRMMGLRLVGEGSIASAISAMKRTFSDMNLNKSDIDLYDVCGLSASNTITPEFMVNMLAEMTKHRQWESFYNSMLIAGDEDGDSHVNRWGRGTGIANNARVKTGLINRVRSHSGYVSDKKGRLIAFSMIANNYKGRTSNINEIHKRILIKLSELK